MKIYFWLTHMMLLQWKTFPRAMFRYFGLFSILFLHVFASLIDVAIRLKIRGWGALQAGSGRSSVRYSYGKQQIRIYGELDLDRPIPIPMFDFILFSIQTY